VGYFRQFCSKEGKDGEGWDLYGEGVWFTGEGVVGDTAYQRNTYKEIGIISI